MRTTRRRASRTARVVAVGRSVGLLVPGRDDQRLRDPVVGRLLPWPDRQLSRLLRASGVPLGRAGLAAHATLRMAAVDAAVEAAVAAVDPPAVVVVGAGYDTRAWRLSALRGRRVLELDHPATQASKRAGLGAAAVGAGVVELVPVDLAADDLDEVLDAAGHDPSSPTVWLWEAVVPYLPPDAVEATLAVLSRRSTPGSRLVVTTVTPALVDPPVPGFAPPARLAMRLLGEPVRLAEDDAEVVARLARHGFDSDGGRGPRDWARDAGVDVVGPVLDERLHLATRR